MGTGEGGSGLGFGLVSLVFGRCLSTSLITADLPAFSADKVESATKVTKHQRNCKSRPDVNGTCNVQHSNILILAHLLSAAAAAAAAAATCIACALTD